VLDVETSGVALVNTAWTNVCTTASYTAGANQRAIMRVLVNCSAAVGNGVGIAPTYTTSAWAVTSYASLNTAWYVSATAATGTVNSFGSVALVSGTTYIFGVGAVSNSAALAGCSCHNLVEIVGQ
jgi:hypothetical protein